MAVEVRPHQPPETVAGQPPQEGRRQAKPGHGPHDVERAAAEAGIDMTGRIDDEVDQGLARHGYHAQPWIMLVPPSAWSGGACALRP